VIRDLETLARSARSPASDAHALLGSLEATGGFQRLADFIYSSSGSINGFDQYGHFLRAELLVTNCVDYVTTTLSGCEANFLHQTKAGPGAKAPTAATLRNPGAATDRRLRAMRTLLDFAVGPKAPPAGGGR
jgi:hypothetical protein